LKINNEEEVLERLLEMTENLCYFIWFDKEITYP